MTVCEVATHRIFVALRHSAALASSPALLRQWHDALDGLGGFVDLIPSQGSAAAAALGPAAAGAHTTTHTLSSASCCVMPARMPVRMQAACVLIITQT